jgi:PhnB protein
MMVTHGETPMAKHVSPEWQTKIVHARLLVGQTPSMGSDAPPEHYQEMKGFSVSLGIDDPAAGGVFHALAEKGTAEMPIQKTFRALRFGMLVDRFGTPWMINCEEAR